MNALNRHVWPLQSKSNMSHNLVYFPFSLLHIIITLPTTVAIKIISYSHILKIAASWLVTRELLLRERCFYGSYLSFWELNSFIKQLIRIISSIKAAWSCRSCLISFVTCGGTLYPCWGLNQEDPVKTRYIPYISLYPSWRRVLPQRSRSYELSVNTSSGLVFWKLSSTGCQIAWGNESIWAFICSLKEQNR